MKKHIKSAAILVVFTALLCGCSSYKYLLPKGPELTELKPINSGKDFFTIKAYQHNDLKHVRVWTYKPPGWHDTNQVLFVMHGMSRNAEDYLDAWVEIANQKKIMLIAPEFHNRFYQYTTNDYQDGNLYNFFGIENPQEEWAFRVIDNIIDHINDTNAFDIDSYNIFGHSAGSQFVHRMVLLYPSTKLNVAIAANAGVYTIPNEQGDYPYHLPPNHPPLNQAFAKKLIVLVGGNDTLTTSGRLDESSSAKEQGMNRKQRAKYFFEVSQKQSKVISSDFNWQLHTVPDAGHNKHLMIEAAARFL